MSFANYAKRLQRLQPYAEIWRDDGKFVELRAGLYATLYFKHVHPMVDSNQAVREALIESWEDYWTVVGARHRRWIYKFGGGVHGYKLPSTKVPPIATYLRDPENFGSYQYYVHGGNNEDDASEYLFSLAAFTIYGAPEVSAELGYLRLQAPLGYLHDEAIDRFSELVCRCAARLNVDQGHGGLGFLRTYNEESTTRFSEAQLSKVFSGVDIDVPYVQLADFDDREGGTRGIDSPHWLNLLSDRWVSELGGIEALRSQLPSDTFVVKPYGGGVYIQAGARPEPGHRDDGLPSPYVWLNRVLLPVRAPTMGYCMGDEPGQLGVNQGGWPYFTRLDAASEKLILTERSGNSSGTSSASTLENHAAALALRCFAGERCPRTGFWFTPARPDSRAQFAQGVVMPDVGGEFGTTVWQRDRDQSAAVPT